MMDVRIVAILVGVAITFTLQNGVDTRWYVSVPMGFIGYFAARLHPTGHRAAPGPGCTTQPGGGAAHEATTVHYGCWNSRSLAVDCAGERPHVAGKGEGAGAGR